ncbi:hypothetical protein P3S68_023529 [Capsicum galapagoense]
MANNSLLYIVLILLIIPLELSTAKCLFSPKYRIHIINNLPVGSAPLKMHCASGDDDLGEYFPAINEDVNWSFCGSIFGKSLHFWKKFVFLSLLVGMGRKKVEYSMYLIIKKRVSMGDKSLMEQGIVCG